MSKVKRAALEMIQLKLGCDFLRQELIDSLEENTFGHELDDWQRGQVDAAMHDAVKAIDEMLKGKK